MGRNEWNTVKHCYGKSTNSKSKGDAITRACRGKDGLCMNYHVRRHYTKRSVRVLDV